MLEQLKANTGKTVVIELVNGRKIPGVVLSADQQYVRLETDEGTGTIPVQAVYIVWEAPSRTLTGKDMDEIAEKLRDSVKAEIACTSFPGFTCAHSYICRPPDSCTFSFDCPGTFVPGIGGGGGSQCGLPGGFSCPGLQFYGIVGPGQVPPATEAAGQDIKAEIACTSFPGFTCARNYICRPPDTCTFSFACPGRYTPGFPSGGGLCPFFACGPFQFGQPCGPFQFGQPCGPFQFGQPCGPFQFGQPCGPFQFGQPCSPFVFGGSQCGVPGGFVCPGQQFIGAAPGGPIGPGPIGPGPIFPGPIGPGPGPIFPGPLAQVPPLSPMEISAKEVSKSEDKKETKE